MSKRKIVWLELFAQDRAATAKFYGDLFGFEVKDFPDMNYTTLDTGNDELGIGIGQVTDETPGATTFYIASTDIPADLEKIKAHGGIVVVEPMDIPGVGTMAFFKDPGGNLAALGDFQEM